MSEIKIVTKPILFSTAMVQAILHGKKTVTRRLIKPQPKTDVSIHDLESGDLCFYNGRLCKLKEPRSNRKYAGELVAVPIEPPYQIGDVLYVRETWSTAVYLDACTGMRTGLCPYENCENPPGPCFTETKYIYKATDKLPYGSQWHPSIHMPREAARIFLRVTQVWYERLQKISLDECVGEGAVQHPDYTKRNTLVLHARYRGEFAQVWNNTIDRVELDRYGWDANPWVWCIGFGRTMNPNLFQEE